VSPLSALLFLASMVAALAWFWWCSRPAQLQRTAAARQKLPWVRNRRSVEQDIAYQRRITRYVMLPAAALLVLAAAGTLISALAAR
jgi:hypothetical protein